MKPIRIAGFLLGMFVTGTAAGQGNDIVDQRDFGSSNNACGPASILNCLKFSRPELQEVYGKLTGGSDGMKMRFVVDRYLKLRDQEESDHEPAWEIGPHHNVVVTAAGDFAVGSGFLLTALDRREGREIAIFVYRDGAQSFRALKGIESGGVWHEGRSFPIAVAPEAVSLQPRTLAWHERFLIVANFLIGDF